MAVARHFDIFLRTPKVLWLMQSPSRPSRQTPSFLRALEEVAPLRAPVHAGRHQLEKTNPEQGRRRKGTNQQSRQGWMTRRQCDGSLPVRSEPLHHRWRAAAVAMGRLSRLKVIAVNVCVLSAAVCFAPASTVFCHPLSTGIGNRRPPRMRFCPGKNDGGEV